MNFNNTLGIFKNLLMDRAREVAFKLIIRTVRKPKNSSLSCTCVKEQKFLHNLKLIIMCICMSNGILHGFGAYYTETSNG